MLFADAQCKFAILQHFYDAGGHLFSDPWLLCGAKEFFFRDQCGETVIHGYKCSEIFADLIDPAGDLVIFL